MDIHQAQNTGDFEVVQLNEGPYTMETGRLARQSDGSVLVTFGETKVLATVNWEELDEPLPFLPLTVDYEEKFYAGGKIPGGFFKREGKPSEEAMLNARMIDRPIRPLFPEGYNDRVHVVVTVLSADQDHPPEVAAMLGASAALTISSVPFLGPIAGVKVGMVDGEFVINPTAEQCEASSMDVIVAGTEQAVTMVEGEMDEIPEEQVVEAVKLAHQEIRRLTRLQEEFIRETGAKPKIEVEPPEGHDELEAELQRAVGDRLEALWGPMGKLEREALADRIRDEAIEQALDGMRGADMEMSDSNEAELERAFKDLFEGLLKSFVRRRTLEKETRIDGRGPQELRPISCEVGILPRVHGSALFTRGETQSVGTCTLGTTRQDEQIIDVMMEEGRKRFMLHYNFPPYSVGEAGRLGPPKRREIGHGHLAETAIKPLLPSEEEFPYIIRVVSEITESNGSSSMASVCSGTLSLMDAGVPLRKPVAGVGVGLIEEDDRFLILTDIAGYEDRWGDMDFKVAGTREGLTAFQLDVKVSGISDELMGRAMEQARRARLQILDVMEETLSEPRSQLSKYAPLIEIINIDPDKIGTLIGPGGRMIRKILEETGAEIDIEDDGTVKISGPNRAAVQDARQRVEYLTEEVEEGDRYRAHVVRLAPFGAFAEIKPGVQGLIHISNLSDRHVEKVEDVVDVGDEVDVRVTEIDGLGRINLERIVEREPIEEGDRYQGRVKGIAEYGAFVEFQEGVSGLIHISNLSEGHVSKVEDVVQVGDRVTVEVARIDEKGRYSLKLLSKEGDDDAGSGSGSSARVRENLQTEDR